MPRVSQQVAETCLIKNRHQSGPVLSINSPSRSSRTRSQSAATFALCVATIIVPPTSRTSSLDQLQITIAHGQGDRSTLDQNLITLTERLGHLTDHMHSEQDVLIRLAEAQSQMKTLLTRIAETASPNGGFDDASRTHIRNLDVRLEHLIREMGTGREQSVQEIRGEIRLLTRTIAAMAEESG